MSDGELVEDYKNRPLLKKIGDKISSIFGK